MKVTLHEWLGKAFGVTETHWDEAQEFFTMTTALTSIQAWWRGWRTRRMVLEDITMRTIAAIRIQTNWRGKAGRLALRRLVRLRLLKVRLSCKYRPLECFLVMFAVDVHVERCQDFKIRERTLEEMAAEDRLSRLFERKHKAAAT